MAEIKLNKEQWESLSDEERGKIYGALLAAGSISAEDQIVGDASAPRIPVDEGAAFISLPNLGEELCKAACDVIFTTAKAACIKLGNPIAVAACITAAEEARKFCKDKC